MATISCHDDAKEKLQSTLDFIVDVCFCCFSTFYAMFVLFCFCCFFFATHKVKSYSWRRNEPVFGSLLLGDVTSSSVDPGGHRTRFKSRYTRSWNTALRPFRLTSSQHLQIQLILHNGFRSSGARGGESFALIIGKSLPPSQHNHAHVYIHIIYNLYIYMYVLKSMCDI